MRNIEGFMKIMAKITRLFRRKPKPMVRWGVRRCDEDGGTVWFLAADYRIERCGVLKFFDSEDKCIRRFSARSWLVFGKRPEAGA